MRPKDNVLVTSVAYANQISNQAPISNGHTNFELGTDLIDLSIVDDFPHASSEVIINFYL